MSLNLKEVFEFLRDNKYILADKGKYVFSNKFYQDKGNMKEGVVQFKDLVPVVVVPLITGAHEMRFINFITAAKVPRRLEGSRGELYDVNKYSEPAAKEFDKLLRSGIDVELLIKATQLYYASGTGFKKKIGNYIIDGDWRTDYLALKDAAGSGEEALTDHIKDQLDNGEHNPYIF